MVAAGLAGPAEVVAGGVQDNTEGDFVGVYVQVDGCGDGLVDEGVVDSKQAPYFLFGQVRDLSAESTPGPAQRGLDCLVDQFDLPTLRVAGRPGRRGRSRGPAAWSGPGTGWSATAHLGRRR